LADCNLGTLVTWLRILGYDTLYDRGLADPAFLRRAEATGRIALTRRRSLAGHAGHARMVLVTTDRVETQLAEVLTAVGARPDPTCRMSLCLKCNVPLAGIERGEAEGLVPAYVFERYRDFHRCPLCRRIYWPGTHRLRVEEILSGRSPGDRP
jgi:hypothetical protein